MAEDILQQHLDSWKRKLLDISKRSNLIKYRYRKMRSLHVVCPDIRSLLQDMAERDSIVLTEYDNDKKDGFWHIFGDKSSINKKLKNIIYTNNVNAGERGINNCYVGLFLLHYFEPTSDEQLSAPLFLKSVSITKNKDISSLYYTLNFEDTELELNLSLKEKLYADYDILLPQLDQEVESYLNDLIPLVEKRGWYVTPFAVIDNFSYQKQMLYNDIVEHPDEYKSSLLIQQFCGLSGTSSEGNIKRMNKRMDVQGMDIFPTDSSQKEVIENAKLGKSMVVQGPPGTGKSQTISNIIISLISEGKKVLFVSQKRAALDVVYSKLEQAGVHGACLRLHATDSKKKEIVDDIMHQLKYSCQLPPHDSSEISTYLMVQDKINNYYEKLCEKDENFNISPYELRGILSHYSDVPILEKSLASLFYTVHQPINEIMYNLNIVQKYLEDTGQAANSAIYSVSLSQGDSERISQFTALVKEHATAMEYYNALFERISPQLGNDFSTKNAVLLAQIHQEVLSNTQPLQRYWKKDLPSEIARMNRMLSFYEEIESLLAELGAFVSTEFIDLDTEAHENSILSASTIGKLFNKQYKESKAFLSQYQKRQLSDKEWDIVFSQKKRILSLYEALSSIKTALIEEFPSLTTVLSDKEGVNNELESIRTINDIVDMAKQACYDGCWDIIGTLGNMGEVQYADLLEGIKGINYYFPTPIITDYMPFSESIRILTEIVNGLPHLGTHLYSRSILESMPQSVQNFVSAYYETDQKYNLDIVFKKSYCAELYSHLLNVDISQSPKHEALYLKKDDVRIRDIARCNVVNNLIQRKPKQYYDAPLGGVRTIKREHEKKRRLKPLRQLFVETSDLIFTIKPCFMMSPLAVCQYIDIHQMHFDVVIFDEASQIMPEDAASCFVRADQAIIAGDSKQLPPTNFFNRDDEEDEDVVDMLDSLLKEGSIVFPELYLRWHYRSRDESLIAYSNMAYYGNDLITFPQNTLPESSGIKFSYVAEGIYDRSRSRTNRIEAEKVMTHFQEIRNTYPDASLGIIAFSISQERAIRDAFEKEGLLLEDMESPKTYEPFFIKNLETVQGDERDIIILSIGYGKDSTGKLSYNFGPINRDEGYKRLNVATTRSRYMTIVVSSVSYKDFDDSHIHNQGLLHLKNYLRYAETGLMEGATEVTEHLPFDSQFEESVYEELVSRGYDVAKQVGCSGYRIDLAIKDPNNPGMYLVGIECDGAQYHASKYARDRDRIRQGVLESLGWNIYRIWSDDWLRNRSSILEEIDHIISSSHKEMTNVSEDESFKAFEECDSPHNVNPATHYPSYDSVYVKQSPISFSDYADSEEIPEGTPLYSHCCHTISEILYAEAPITKDLLMRKTLSSVGVKRFSARTQRTFDKLLSSYGHINGIYEDNGTIFIEGIGGPLCPVRISTDSERTFDQIPIQELSQAILDIMVPGGVDIKEIIKVIPYNVYGFKRTGGKIRSRMLEAISFLSKNAYVKVSDEKVHLQNDI